MTDDKFLPRIVAVGLIGLAALIVSASVVLKINGVAAEDLTTIAGAIVGALASFFAGVQFGKARGTNTTDA